MLAEYQNMGIIRDNDRQYFYLLEGVIDSVDELAQMLVSASPTRYYFRILPSNSAVTDLLVDEILALNNLVGIQLHLSKSIKSTASISFYLDI